MSSDTPSTNVVDGWLEKIKKCQHLLESELKQLCDMVTCFVMFYFLIVSFVFRIFFSSLLRNGFFMSDLISEFYIYIYIYIPWFVG